MLKTHLRYDKANNKNKDLDCVRMENGKFTRVPCTSTSGAYVCENHNYGDRCQASQTQPKIDNRYFISNDARKGWEGKLVKVFFSRSAIINELNNSSKQFRSIDKHNRLPIMHLYP